MIFHIKSILHLLLFAALVSLLSAQCIHDQFSINVTKHFYNDLHEGRIMQAADVGKYIHFSILDSEFTSITLKSQLAHKPKLIPSKGLQISLPRIFITSWRSIACLEFIFRKISVANAMCWLFLKFMSLKGQWGIWELFVEISWILRQFT